jgi:hypothetical protein
VIADLKKTAPDRILQGGDLAFSGSQPAEVVDRIRDLGWPGVLGNTDEILWAPERQAELEKRAPRLRSLFGVLFGSIAPATRERLGDERIAWLRSLPAEWREERLFLLHAAPQNLWRAPMADATDEQLGETYGGAGAATVVYGHIHTPFVRQLPGMTVANTGSLSLSYDGDPRASYLLLEDGGVTIRRVEYDVEREVRSLLESTYPCAAWIAEILRNAKYVPPFEETR